MNDYKTIFDRRALEYAFALEKYPEIRAQEFINIINNAQISHNHNVLDLACGNAIISDYLKHTNYYGVDPCPNFFKVVNNKRVVAGSLRKLPFKNNYFDRLICLTGLHHETSRKEIYDECFRVLNDNGKLIIHDVEIDSNISIFLDNFVDFFNPVGHQGHYLGHADILELQKIGFMTKTSLVEYEWVAQDICDMFDFMTNLFGLEQLTLDAFTVEMPKYLDITVDADSFRVHWNLLSIEAVKK